MALVTVQVAAMLSMAQTPASAATFGPTEWVIGPEARVVMLTFNGSPRARAFLETLETLESKNAKATFFLPGSWVEHHKEKSRLARLAGHTLGNRGYGDARFTSLSDAALRSSIARAERVLKSVGERPKPFLRAPSDARDARVLRVAGSMGYRSVHWTYRPGGGTAKSVKRRVVRQARAGSIVSLDLWRKSNRMAVEGIIDGLRRRGFDLKTIDNLTNVQPIRYDVTLQSGSSGADVKLLQKLLNRGTYPAGRPNGSFGYATLQATYAFQKTRKLTRDGVVTPGEMVELAKSGPPRAPRNKPENYTDIDISRQVMFEVRRGKVRHTTPISSGNEEYYTVDGQTYKAHTPRGDFSVVRKIAGKRVSRLGTLWWPSYFVGGFAVHGSDSVPTYPASHGCVRIPRYVEKKFFYRNPVGTPLYVHD
jgi:peptidoglycan/xylan/chitin deacetylase (PgdA/CDA1 family)/lipoprotein-anchoring transpeptidase ErfK/SrfK